MNLGKKNIEGVKKWEIMDLVDNSKAFQITLLINYLKKN